MKVEKLDHYGRGIVKQSGKIGFIENALEFEDIDIEIFKDYNKYFEGKSKKIKNKNINRIKPKCQYYDICGGCHLLHMNDFYQTKFKEEKIKNIVLRYLNSNIKINELIKDNNFYYRNKIVLHIKNNKIGFYQNKTKNLVTINSCLIANKKINELITFLAKIEDFEEIEKITIKVGNLTNEVMLILEGKLKNYLKYMEFCDVLVINNKVMTDKKYISSYIGNKKYFISKDSFFQINYVVATKMYNQIRYYISKLKSKNVLDLYCGTGTIGIYIADLVNKVLGIEIVEDAVKDAKLNKEHNNINNISFLLGKVEDKIECIKHDYDTIIVDPPRSGLNKKIIPILRKIKPKNIIYVSCDPITLMRDLNFLIPDYNIEELTPYDMFPNTYHLECLCLLTRKTKY